MSTTEPGLSANSLFYDGPVMPKQAFAPVADKNARLLILGSMPGERSLAEQQYYAHPQNLFWVLMDELLGIDKRQVYEKRLLQLKQHHIALWDVLRECERKGSLDQHIRNEKPNDFVSFLREHPRISRIGFNGHKAHDAFIKHVVRIHSGCVKDIEMVLLPSTSPAHAGKTKAAKKKEWQKFLNH